MHFRITQSGQGPGVKVLSFQEGVQVNLTFALVSNCKQPEALPDVIKVEKLPADEGGSPNRICQFLNIGGKCLSGSPDCVCPGEDGGGDYVVAAEAERSLTGAWMISASSPAVQEAMVHVSVTYPPHIQGVDVTVNGSYTKFITQGSNVEVACIFNRGNPPTAPLPQLFKDDDAMTSKLEGSQIKHMLTSSSCDDSGLVTCKGVGYKHSQSAAILVKCKPEVAEESQKNFTTSKDEDLTLTFPFRSHTKDMEKCQLRKVPLMTSSDAQEIGPYESSFRGPFHCEQFDLLMTGAAPNMKLNLRLRKDTPHREGKWSLEIANEVGETHVEFFVYETGVEEESQIEDSSQNFVSTKEFLYLVGAFGGVVFIVVVVAIVIITKKGRSSSLTSARDDSPADEATDALVVEFQPSREPEPVEEPPAPLVDPQRPPTYFQSLRRGFQRYPTGPSEPEHAYEEIRDVMQASESRDGEPGDFSHITTLAEVFSSPPLPPRPRITINTEEQEGEEEGAEGAEGEGREARRVGLGAEGGASYDPRQNENRSPNSPDPARSLAAVMLSTQLPSRHHHPQVSRPGKQKGVPPIPGSEMQVLMPPRLVLPRPGS